MTLRLGYRFSYLRNFRCVIQRFADLASFGVFALEGKRRSPRRHFQIVNLRPRVQQFFRQPVTEIFVVRIVADVDEG